MSVPDTNCHAPDVDGAVTSPPVFRARRTVSSTPVTGPPPPPLPANRRSNNLGTAQPARDTEYVGVPDEINFTTTGSPGSLSAAEMTVAPATGGTRQQCVPATVGSAPSTVT